MLNVSCARLVVMFTCKCTQVGLAKLIFLAITIVQADDKECTAEAYSSQQVCIIKWNSSERPYYDVTFFFKENSEKY